MRKLFIAFFFITASIFAQKYQYAWISDLHIGSPNAEKYLDTIVTLINSNDDLQFTIASGDITEKGKSSELQKAKEILDKLRKPYYIIPGNHDTKWSESGGLKFKDFWKDDKFIFEFSDDVYIGLNTGIIWKGGGGHFAPDDLVWLENELQKIKHNTPIYIFIHHPLNSEIDNWYKFSNIIRNYNVQAVLYGHGHTNKIEFNNGIQCAMGRSALSRGQTKAGLNIVVNSKNELSFFEITSELNPLNWGTISKSQSSEIKFIDSLEVIPFGNKIIFHKDFTTTISVEPLIWERNIYISAYNGIISALDSLGNILWQHNSAGHILSRPIIRDGYFVFGTLEGELTTLNAYTGELIQTIGLDETVTSQFIAYDAEINTELIFPKSTDSKAAVVFGTGSGKMFCYDIETLQELWRFEAPKGMIETQPLLINNKLIFGTWDSKVYCLNAQTGRMIWDWRANQNFYFSPAVCKPISDGRTIFLATPEKIIYAIDLRLGLTNWSSVDFSAWESLGLSKNKSNLLLKSIDGKFHIIPIDNIKKTETYEIGFSIDTMPSNPLELKDEFLINTKDGDLYSIHPKKFFQKIFHLGTSRMHSPQKFSENKILISNMDGRIILFEPVNK